MEPAVGVVAGYGFLVEVTAVSVDSGVASEESAGEFKAGLRVPNAVKPGGAKSVVSSFTPQKQVSTGSPPPEPWSTRALSSTIKKPSLSPLPLSPVGSFLTFVSAPVSPVLRFFCA